MQKIPLSKTVPLFLIAVLMPFASMAVEDCGTSVTECQLRQEIKDLRKEIQRLKTRFYYVGRFDVPVDFNAKVTNWTKVNKGKSVGFTLPSLKIHLDPGQKLYTRMCMSYADSAARYGPIMRIRRGTKIFYKHAFGACDCGSQLIHHSCGKWAVVDTGKDVFCSYGWGNACTIEVDHPQDVNVYIQKISMEMAVK